MSERSSASVSVVDYQVGNLGSVINMFRRLGVDAEVISHPEEAVRAQRLLVPGVGAFDYGMARLSAASLDEAIRRQAHAGVPVLGICLGMQMLTRGSAEGQSPGLGLIPAECRKITPTNAGLKVPHMGWNWLAVRRPHTLIHQLPQPAKFYFAHSYQVVCDEDGDLIATTNYGGAVSAFIGRENVCGAQFHPEKSHHFGLSLLEAFAKWTP